MKENIIIIEDDENIREELKKFLSKYGYNVFTPTDFNNIIKYIKEISADLILLDINLPIFDGYYICREIRKFSDIPIIIVTSRDSEIDEIMSMNLGADDFITKPYNTDILLLRLENIFKRMSRNNKNDIINIGGIKLNLSDATITYNENSLELTKNEMRIIYILIKNNGKIVSREDIMEYLWKSDYFVDDNTLSVNINRLRKKLREVEIEDLIETRKGLGYLINISKFNY